MNFDISDLAGLLIDCAAAAGLDARRTDDAWPQIAAQAAWLPVDADPAYMTFSRAMMDARCAVQDLALQLYHDRKPVALWPVLALRDRQADARWRLGTNLEPLCAPLFVAGVAAAVRDKIGKAAARAALNWCQRVGAAALTHQQCLGPEQAATSAFHAEWLRAGARPQAAYYLYVDLSLSPDAIRASYRKSYKALINSAERLWRVHVQEHADAALFEQFHQLHVAVAGRETRSAATWTLQHDAIARGGAFAVYLHDAAGRMVGGGYFQHTVHESVYLVGAYDRNLFDKPLGHLVQHVAIGVLARRGVRWHKLGQRYYPGCAAPGSDKEQSISTFKEGFATHQFVRLDSELLFPGN